MDGANNTITYAFKTQNAGNLGLRSGRWWCSESAASASPCDVVPPASKPSS